MDLRLPERLILLWTLGRPTVWSSACRALAEAVRFFGIASSVIVFDETCTVLRHGIWAQEVVKVVVFGCAMDTIGLHPAGHLLASIAGDFSQGVVVHGRWLESNAEMLRVVTRHEVLAYEELAVVVSV